MLYNEIKILLYNVQQSHDFIIFFSYHNWVCGKSAQHIHNFGMQV